MATPKTKRKTPSAWGSTYSSNSVSKKRWTTLLGIWQAGSLFRGDHSR